jgi:hypothetical protein
MVPGLSAGAVVVALGAVVAAGAVAAGAVDAVAVLVPDEPPHAEATRAVAPANPTPQANRAVLRGRVLTGLVITRSPFVAVGSTADASEGIGGPGDGHKAHGARHSCATVFGHE